ncbi:MAG: hypothetical protein ACREVI_13295 [Steroidobacteraceae bacterium]
MNQIAEDERKNLTKRVIETLSYRGTAPERAVRWDDLVPSFGVRIYPSGRKTFVINYRHQGRMRCISSLARR